MPTEEGELRAGKPTPTFDPLESLQLLLEQWGESPNLRALLRGLLDVMQRQMVTPLTVLSRALSTDEGEGILLDWLGARLGFPRPTLPSASVRVFGFRGSDGVGFNQAPFTSRRLRLEAVEPLSDTRYRPLLRARARRLRGGLTERLSRQFWIFCWKAKIRRGF